MLVIKDLHVSIDGKEIIKGLNLTVNAGEVHAIMGPNGTGKNTLANVIAGKDEYEITQGSITNLGHFFKITQTLCTVFFLAGIFYLFFKLLYSLNGPFFGMPLARAVSALFFQRIDFVVDTLQALL